MRAYGGRVRRRPAPVCNLFAGPAAPRAVTAAPDAFGGLAVGVTRPAPRARPAHLAHVSDGSYEVGLRRDSCPSPSEALLGRTWRVPVGASESVTLPRPPPGRYCVAAWARDGVGRLSRSATTFVDL